MGFQVLYNNISGIPPAISNGNSLGCSRHRIRREKSGAPPAASSPPMKSPFPATTLSLVLALPVLTPRASAQTSFPQFASTFAPITGYLAGTGIVTTSTVPESSEWLASYEGAAATTVNLSNPHIAMADVFGNVFIADKASHSILKVTPDGKLHTFAGTHVYPYTGAAPAYAPPAGFAQDGPAPATSLNLVACNGLYVLPNGVVYIYDAGNHRIRRVGLDGIMSTVVNDPDPLWLPSGRGLWVSPAEDLIYYTQEVADLNTPIPPTSINHPPLGGVVKKWTPAGGIKAITAYPASPSPANLELTNPGNIDVSPITHKLYVTDRAEDNPANSCVYRIEAEAADPLVSQSTKTVVAGIFGASGGSTADGGLATATYLNQVRGISFTREGGYFVCTHKGGQVWYVDSEAADAKIHLFLNGRGKNDIQYTGPTPLPLPVTTTECDSQPRAVTVAPDGSVLVVSNDSGLVRKIKKAVLPALPVIQTVAKPTPSSPFQLTWTSLANESYIIERRPDLLTGTWETAGVVTPTGNLGSFNDPALPGISRAFYRLSLPR